MKPFGLLAKKTFARRRQLSSGVAGDFSAPEHSQKLQLDRLNRVWRTCTDNIPYYRDLKAEHDLPVTFESLDEFSERIPVCRKEHVQKLGDALFDLTSDRYPLSWSMTGGSTAQPVRFPKWRSELDVSEANEWYLRSRLGIKPEDPYFRLWGHSHTLGHGPSRLLRVIQRKVKDHALGMTRVSAYDLSEEKVRYGLKLLTRSNAVYAIGYSRAWEHYAAVLERLPSVKKQLPSLRCLIATSESFSSEASRTSVEETFGMPLIMEYGSEETGPIAQEMDKGDYQAAWPTFYLEVVDDDNGTGRLIVTSLYPRAFPLIRYDLGDLVSGYDQSRGLRQFKHIVGRSNATFACPDGTILHSQPIGHVLRATPEVERFQVVTKMGTASELLLVAANEEAVRGKLGEVRLRMAQVNRSLAELPVRIVKDVRTTPAGKRPTIFILNERLPEQ